MKINMSRQTTTVSMKQSFKKCQWQCRICRNNRNLKCQQLVEKTADILEMVWDI